MTENCEHTESVSNNIATIKQQFYIVLWFLCGLFWK